MRKGVERTRNWNPTAKDWRKSSFPAMDTSTFSFFSSPIPQLELQYLMIRWVTERLTLQFQRLVKAVPMVYSPFSWQGQRGWIRYAQGTIRRSLFPGLSSSARSYDDGNLSHYFLRRSRIGHFHTRTRHSPRHQHSLRLWDFNHQVTSQGLTFFSQLIQNICTTCQHSQNENKK